MRGRIIGVYALLSAGASQAHPVDEPYANAGAWEITAGNHGACMMQRSYVLRDNGDEQTLIIFYDDQRKGAVLGWGTHKPKLPPLSNALEFQLSFTRTGSSLNEAWGSQSFDIQKIGDEYRFGHVFKGSTDSDRFLRDLASSDTIGLWFGPTLMMGLPLGASDAVAKLRECSSRIAEQDTSGRLQK
ncbi:hypothetical protein SCH01S_33_00310 [Sphingomonas changbaiensis NBRC 104936]|uniref:Uncharacterized protein n=1 Tax=Sphingomonas changbaiensis NBRC 104936 TaxID=1219043 RepID=A0A0E9MPS2_9SPHN|nr:hypothetical protein [Sphingomonas changbaiensis]GAO39544.1 hypothetical protein SCH01S_33_00310 [Sphingomonas changbaiensis NBRC 104936]